jgi:hypothetical protein
MTEEEFKLLVHKIQSKLDTIVKSCEDNNAREELTQFKAVLIDELVKLYANIERVKTNTKQLITDNQNLLNVLCDDCMNTYEYL